MSSTAPIFNIQSLSTQDGPGLRTTVFLQGCPLRCTWCSNPEGQSAEPQLRWQTGRCQGCLACAKACPHGAVHTDEKTPLVQTEQTAGLAKIEPAGDAANCEQRSGIAPPVRPRFDRTACRACAAWSCVTACPTGAIDRVGRSWTAEELLSDLRRDLRLMRNSGGGVTFTGGEPLLYTDFLRPVLQSLHDNCVSIAVETCGSWDWAKAGECLRLCDLIFFDVKILDDDVHRRFTGRSNELILSNLRALAETCPDRVIVSLPIVPGVLDSAALVEQVGQHIRNLGLARVRLLPYHRLGFAKYEWLGLPYPHESWDVPIAASILNDMARRLSDLGLETGIEGWA